MTDKIRDGRSFVVALNSELDDYPLSSRAFRVYCHLARRAGSKDNAFPKYQSIGDCCFGKDSDSPRTRRDWAMESVEELVNAGMLDKAPRFRDDGSQTSNDYFLLPKEDWKDPQSLYSDPPSRCTATPPVAVQRPQEVLKDEVSYTDTSYLYPELKKDKTEKKKQKPSRPKPSRPEFETEPEVFLHQRLVKHYSGLGFVAPVAWQNATQQETFVAYASKMSRNELDAFITWYLNNNKYKLSEIANGITTWGSKKKPVQQKSQETLREKWEREGRI